MYLKVTHNSIENESTDFFHFFFVFPAPDLMMDYDYDKATNTLVAVPFNRHTAANFTGNRLSELASERDMLKSPNSNNFSRNKTLSKLSNGNRQRMSVGTTAGGGNHRLNTVSSHASNGSPSSKPTKREMQAELEFTRKNGKRRVKLRTKMLFAGYKRLIERLDQEIEATLTDCFISVNLENQFMSETQLYELNPLCIRLNKCTSMPNKPVSYEQLRKVKLMRLVTRKHFIKFSILLMGL